MSASALLFQQGLLRQSSYQGGVNSTFGFTTPNSPNHPLTVLIEKQQIVQMIPDINNFYNRNSGNIGGLIRAVQHFEETGRNPIVVAVFNGIGGHAVVPFRVNIDAAGFYKIDVWDCNHPNTIMTLLINPDMRGWSFNGSGGWGTAFSGNWISFIPFEVINMHRNSASQMPTDLLIAANTPSLITNSEGVSWENIPGAQRLFFTGGSSGFPELYSLPADSGYVIRPLSGNTLDIDIAGETFHIQTDSSDAHSIVISPGGLDVVIKSSANENHIELTIGTDDGEHNLLAIVSGDLHIVEDGDTVKLFGDGKITEEESDAVTFYNTGSSLDMQMSSVHASEFSVDNPYTILQTSNEKICPNIETASIWARDEINEAIQLMLVPDDMQNLYFDELTFYEFSKLSITLYESIKEVIVIRTSSTEIQNDYVQKAVSLGLTNGLERERILPETILTKEQAAVMLMNLAKALDVCMPSNTILRSNVLPFSDETFISTWAVNATRYMRLEGLMDCKETHNDYDLNFEPKERYLREHGIVSIFRLYIIATDDSNVDALG
jgi:hypothetical protein